MIDQKKFTLKNMKTGQMRTFSPKNRTFSKKQDKLSKNMKNMKTGRLGPLNLDRKDRKIEGVCLCVVVS